MQITRASDYAVRVMVHLASLSEEKKVLLTALVHATGVKESFLSKVLQRLVPRDFVSSHRGTGGGFCLKMPPVRTTLLEVIEAIDGPLELNLCLGVDKVAIVKDGAAFIRSGKRRKKRSRPCLIAGLAQTTARNLSALEAVSVSSGEPVVTERMK